MNPVLARETKERFRARKALPFLTFWVIATGMITYGLYVLAQELAGNRGMGRLLATGYVGRFLFQSMVLVLMTGVIFVVPGSAALGIVTERERQTFQLLQATQLTPFQLVFGKLSASVAYLLILLTAALPMAAVPLLFGGAGLGDVLAALGMLLVTAVMLAAVAVWVSARARSSRGAMAGSAALAFLIAFLTFAMMGGELLWHGTGGGSEGFGVQRLPNEGVEIYSVLPNPYFGIIDAIAQPYEVQQTITGTPFTPFESVLFRRQGVDMAVGGWINDMRPGRLQVEDGRQLVKTQRLPLYVYTIGIYTMITGLALWRATKAVRAPGGRMIRLKRVRGGAT